MGTKKTVFGLFIVLTFLFVSCSSPKRAAVSCTEFPVYRFNKTIRNHVIANHQKATLIYQPFTSSKKKHESKKAVLKNSDPGHEIRVKGTESITIIGKAEYSKSLTASTENTVLPFVSSSSTERIPERIDLTEKANDPQKGRCDTIILRSGSFIPCKIAEINLKDIKYRKCNYQDGPVITILKSDVAVINFGNGTSEIIISSNPNDFNARGEGAGSMPKQSPTLGTIGFLTSLVGLFVASIPLGLVAIIFGASAIGKINRDPQKYKGRGLAAATIIIGFIEVVLTLAFLASMNNK